MKNCCTHNNCSDVRIVEDDKRRFMLQYTLNRSLGASTSCSGRSAAIEAEAAWNEINKRSIEA